MSPWEYRSMADCRNPPFGRLVVDSHMRASEALACGIDGLRRAWISLTWLDKDQRLIAQLPEGTPVPREDEGLSAHLSAPVKSPDGRVQGTLIVRYAPAALLRVGVPWWLARKYDVRL